MPARCGWLALPAISCCAAPLSPWVKTGDITRSGYGFVRALVNAGLVGGAWAHLVAPSVFALPALAALSCAAAVVGVAWLSAAFSGATGVIVLGLTACTAFSNRYHGAPGVWVGAALGSMSVAFIAWDAGGRNLRNARRS